MAIDKEFYNENSAQKLGWKPEWFGKFEEFDEHLTEAITAWQSSHNLTADGLCGPGTFKVLIQERKIATEKEAEEQESNGTSGKEFYNESSAEKLGWTPDWFGEGLAAFDTDLTEAIAKWQTDRDLTADGLCGPSTFRRIWTEREEDIDAHEPVIIKRQQHIVHNGNFIEIDWDRVVLWSDVGGLKCESGTYSSYAGKPDRAPNHFVNHWDVCKTTKSMAAVIAKRGISIHFGIDYDGTIYQLLDTQHAAWQAGGRLWNHTGIGVEICNPYYEKYQKFYTDKGLDPRPIITDGTCHGRSMKPFMGFYPVQLEALAALWAAIHQGLGIPLDVPTKDDGTPETGLHGESVAAVFNGFINHYNLTKRKIDCAHPCLNMPEMAERAKEIVRRNSDGTV